MANTDTETPTCTCAHYKDGSTYTGLCRVHADQDPCLTMSQVTGKRRKGTLRQTKAAVRCTSCGWSQKRA